MCAVYDTEGGWWDLNVEICREYLNSYPAGFVGEEEKGSECNVPHTHSHQTHTTPRHLIKDRPKKNEI